MSSSARRTVRRLIPKPLLAGAWRARRWLRREQPGLLMRYVRVEAPEPGVLPPGYSLRAWEPGDDAGWIDLLNANGAFGRWDEARLSKAMRGLLTGGQWFVLAGPEIVAAAGILERRIAGHPSLELGWVVRHPAHSGYALGLVVVAAAVRFAVARGRAPVHLYTDDHRLTAIGIYLDLGFVPDLTTHRSYARRWERVFWELARRRRGTPEAEPAAGPRQQ